MTGDPLQDVLDRLTAAGLVPPATGYEMSDDENGADLILLSHTNDISPDVLAQIAGIMEGTPYVLKQVTATDGWIYDMPDNAVYRRRGLAARAKRSVLHCSIESHASDPPS